METNEVFTAPLDFKSESPSLVHVDGVVMAHHWVAQSAYGAFGVWQLRGSQTSTVLVGSRSFSVPLPAPLFGAGVVITFLIAGSLFIVGLRRLKKG